MELTKEDIRKRMEEFLEFVREEQEIRDKLLELGFLAASEKEIASASKEQTDLIKQIQTLREERMLPILTELAQFIAEKKDAATVAQTTTPQRKAPPSKAPPSKAPVAKAPPARAPLGKGPPKPKPKAKPTPRKA